MILLLVCIGLMVSLAAVAALCLTAPSEPPPVDPEEFAEFVAGLRGELHVPVFTQRGGFVRVLPSERAEYEIGEAWHKAFAPRAVDLDTTEAANRALDLAFKAQGFEGQA